MMITFLYVYVSEIVWGWVIGFARVLQACVFKKFHFGACRSFRFPGSLGALFFLPKYDYIVDNYNCRPFAFQV